MHAKSGVYTFLTKKQKKPLQRMYCENVRTFRKSLEDRNNAVDGDALNESMDE
ncbi:MAG: hypothetical protein ACJ709_04465 [Nitrososphaeraceae archaeon]